jgi:hypothetical protein
MPVKPQSEFDDQTRVMLFQGASVSQLATLFGYDNRTVTKRIFGLKPCGKRQGHPVYSIRDAAPYLVDPIGDIEAHIKKMNHRDLPPLLLKEFWAGKMQRLKFEKEQGWHWPTDVVIEHYGEVFKTIRTSLLLAVDAVEREAEMTDRQREACKQIIDALMADVREKLVERFANEPRRQLDTEEGGIREITEADIQFAASGSGGGDGGNGDFDPDLDDLDERAAGL